MQIIKNADLQAYNTFGIAVQAAQFCEISTVGELQSLLPIGEPLLVLGGGSNMLFTRNWDGLVLKMAIKGIEILKSVVLTSTIRIGAGENWHDLVQWAVAQNLGGIENLALIPGTVGAAPIQNIGAYGVELKDVFVSLEALNLASGKLEVFSRAKCKFGYRESIFKNELKGKYIIVSVTLRLQRKPRNFSTNYGDIVRILAEKKQKPSISSICEAIIDIRTAKLPDPKKLGNSGSFFKNPEIELAHFQNLKKMYPNMPSYPTASPKKVKVPAGFLIEQAGWKGKRVGNTGSHATQALVLVNYGNATGNEVRNLATKIIESVKEQFGIALSPEVNII